MAEQVLDQLAALIDQQQDELIRAWRECVRQLPSAKGLDQLELENSIAPLLDEIASTLIGDESESGKHRPFNSGPMHHASQRQELGFNIGELIIEYAVLREILREFAQRRGLTLDGRSGIVLHRVIDAAISASVQAFEQQQTTQAEERIREKLSYLVHELKTPLTAAHTAAILLESKLSTESRMAVDTMLHILLRNCERLEDLVMRVIEENVTHDSKQTPMTELDAGLFQLRPLAEGVFANVKSISDSEGTSLQNDVPEDLYIYGDDFLMTQVFQNLLSNAIKYTPKGSIVVGAESSPRCTRLWVRDTGKGIDPKMKSHIFDRNVGDPGRPGSSGLGLTIVRGIVKAHHGSIRVESEIGKGSTFIIEIPPPPPAK